MSLTGHRMPPRTTQQSHRPRVSDRTIRTMVGTLPPRCLQALPHGTKNAATDGPGYRATPRSTTEPHRGWMSDTYLLHLHAEGEKCFLLTSPFIEPAHSSSFRRHPIVLPLVPAHAARPPVFRRCAIRRLHQLLKHNVLRPAARTAHSHLLLPLPFHPLRHVLRFVMRQSLQGPGPRNAHDLHGHTRRKI